MVFRCETSPLCIFAKAEPEGILLIMLLHSKIYPWVGIVFKIVPQSSRSSPHVNRNLWMLLFMELLTHCFKCHTLLIPGFVYPVTRGHCGGSRGEGEMFRPLSPVGTGGVKYLEAHPVPLSCSSPDWWSL